jgi:hypothetical protein
MTKKHCIFLSKASPPTARIHCPFMRQKYLEPIDYPIYDEGDRLRALTETYSARGQSIHRPKVAFKLIIIYWIDSIYRIVLLDMLRIKQKVLAWPVFRH